MKTARRLLSLAIVISFVSACSLIPGTKANQVDGWYKSIEVGKSALVLGLETAGTLYRSGRITAAQKEQIIADGDKAKASLKLANENLSLYFHAAADADVVNQSIAEFARDVQLISDLVGLWQKQAPMPTPEVNK